MEMKLMVLGIAFLICAGIEAKAIPRCEHPRPDLERQSWQCLNGEWEFQFDPEGVGEKEQWFNKSSFKERVIVPFEIESRQSGLSERNPTDYFWYLKRFDLDEKLKEPGRLILHFEAVDYSAKVWLNGSYLGEHIGGYTPFSFEITKLVKQTNNYLAVRVFDSNNKKQVRGKQSSTGKGYGIWYTPVSGIWQTVWLERVGDSYIRSFKLYPDIKNSKLKLKLDIQGEEKGYYLSLRIFEQNGKEIESKIKNISLNLAENIVVDIPEMKLWSFKEPYLYQLEFQISDENGKQVDALRSYFGMREISIKDGEIFLNGDKLYQKLLLVQGYYPDAGYSPVNDDDFAEDLRLLKGMGFNGLRMHQKVEAKRFLYWADKLGVLVWEEMPSFTSEPPDMFLPVSKKYRDQFEKEWREVIERDFNHPSIIVRTVFNESWGIWPEIYSPKTNLWAKKMVKLTRELDSTRLVVDNSGWLHRDTDILDVHQYLSTVEKTIKFYEKLKKPWGTYFPISNTVLMAIRGLPTMAPLYWGKKYNGEPIIISEYGGFGFYKTEPKSLLENYSDYTLAIGNYPYIKGYCYTQEYDIEQEKNGLLDELHKPKVPIDEIRKINEQVGY